MKISTLLSPLYIKHHPQKHVRENSIRAQSLRSLGDTRPAAAALLLGARIFDELLYVLDLAIGVALKLSQSSLLLRLIPQDIAPYVT